MRVADLIIVVSLAFLWYCIVPLLGIFLDRNNWQWFRQRFDDLRAAPFLNYTSLYHGTEPTYRFTGVFESITDTKILWIRGESITVPVNLIGAQIYVFSLSTVQGDVRRIHWNKVPTLIEGGRVYVGGSLGMHNGRLVFTHTKNEPLIIIFYGGDDRSLNERVIWAGRNNNQYFNRVTPYALAAGTFSFLCIAFSFLNRPAFRLTALIAIIAIFTPLFPLLPPGILLTNLYTKLWQQTRLLRSYRDTIQVALRRENQYLPNGEYYGSVRMNTMPAGVPPLVQAVGKSTEWTVFGAIHDNTLLPFEPSDCAALYGFIPGNPQKLIRFYTVTAVLLATAALFLLVAGIGLNIFCIVLLIARIF
ncbi:MAG: hypothetical protein LBO67_04325 [Spirochaetaceae bacterium]|jgi:hypothetical protein|nr:hypothetical protein [Spirochaetaceae bacterium]